MENQKMAENGREGRLPAMAPLANPYVPFQLENPPKYEAQKGLVRGTLFPGLDLPFMGMVNLHELPVTPLTQLQALGFAVQELALYLDTHRDDREALELYRNYQQLLQKGREEYQKRFGPLTHAAPQTSEDYQWLDDPWPWEFTKNKEA
ncbi:MAG: spore coat protein CotJB [Firmicutes bacterium]|nr:spore coat protein CotJB [Bacillota bacterium]